MPGFDGRGPRGQGPMTGRGLGYCVKPIETGYGDTRPNEPFSDSYRFHPRPLSPQPYAFHPPGPVLSYRAPFRGRLGRGLQGRGRFFGPGRGFGRKWW